VEALLEEPEPMCVQDPVIFGDAFFVEGDELVVELVLDEPVEVRVLVRAARAAVPGLARFTAVARPWRAGATWWVAGAAPAELTPRPIPLPTAAALIAMATSALRLRYDMGVSFVRL